MTTPKVHTDELIDVPFVTEVLIEDLFDLYSYHLAIGAGDNSEEGRLLILYGENGSGKTTVLRLLFNLLSKAQGQGHRSYVAGIPFTRLQVKLAPNIVVSAERKSPRPGSYNIRVSKGDSTVLDGVIETDSDNKVIADQPTLTSYINVLVGLQIDLFFLTDDRKSQTSVGGGYEETVHTYRLRQQMQMQLRAGRRVPAGEMTLRSEDLLGLAITRFDNWIREQALKGSSAGEANTNTIYTDIVTRLAKTKPGRPSGKERNIASLAAALRRLEERSQLYAPFGLVAPLKLDPTLKAIESATAATKRVLAKVVGPYVDGIKARLDALESVQRLLFVFVESVNSFLYNKKLSFHLSQGLRIRSASGQVLGPSQLSSGERQLLLLFCNTALARDQASIFLIDEPEISLNVKWQRKLLDSLLQVTKDSPVQFIIATHSLELLSRHRASVCKLEPLPANT